jgi:hypothetical protein
VTYVTSYHLSSVVIASFVHLNLSSL